MGLVHHERKNPKVESVSGVIADQKDLQEKHLSSNYDLGGIEIISAYTPSLLERVYRLRYDVYCVANEFEDPTQQITGFEQDKYDNYSVHSLLIDTQTGADVGSVRLILPNDEVSLPALTVSRAMNEAAGVLFPKETTAEASRFLRAIDVLPGLDRVVPRQSARETLALMTAIVRMSASNGITHVLALMTAPMLRLVNRFGLAFKPIGEPVDFHGRRYAAILDLTVDLSAVATDKPDIWRVLTADGLYYGPQPVL